jgi:lipid-binding SYLF domain-containing protein
VGGAPGAATDARLRAEIYSYSRTRGLFAGLALGGAVIANDPDANRAFGRDTGPEAVRAAKELKAALTDAGGTNRIRRPD